MKTILVPVDFSPATGFVVAWAAQLARGRGARVVLLNVTTVATLLDDHGKLEELAERTFARASPAGAGKARLTGDALELLGKPAAVILDQAQRLPADYIVMGARRSTRSATKIFGATASHVISGAPCPVILVPSPPSKR